MDDEDLRSLWASDPAPLPSPPSPAALAARAASLRRTVWRRNAGEFAASLFVCVVFLQLAYRAEHAPLMRVACGLLITAVAFVVWKLQAHGSNLPAPPADAPTSEHLRHHRESLTRQHALLSGVPRWYLAPFLPGFACFLVAVLTETPLAAAPLAKLLLVSALYCLFLGGVFGLIAWVNRVAARKLAREIEAL